MPAIDVHHLRRVYGTSPPWTGSRSRSSTARCSPCSGRTAPARRRRSRSSRATDRRTPGTVDGAGPRPGDGRAGAARAASESCCRRPGSTRTSPSARARHGCTGRMYPRRLGVDDGHRARGARGEARRAGEDALRWAASPPRPRPRPGRRPGPAVPRRADDRVRPEARRRAWELVESLRALGQDGAADDALHGRGRAPGRSDRRDGARPARSPSAPRRRSSGRRRSDLGRVDPAAARRPRLSDLPSLGGEPVSRGAEWQAARPRPPTRTLYAADDVGGRSRRRVADAHGRRPSLGGRVPGARSPSGPDEASHPGGGAGMTSVLLHRARLSKDCAGSSVHREPGAGTRPATPCGSGGARACSSSSPSWSR